MIRKNLMQTMLMIAVSALTLWAASITSVTKSPDPVGKYVKFELTVALGATYTNPYDPTQIDLSAQFTSPTNNVWKVNGFYNGSQWKIRFAANEIGNWSYVVTATDAGSTAQSPAGTFSCTASTNHGWVKVASNKRYLMCDDGTSWYGIGPCYPWSVASSGLDQLQTMGCNAWVYWNGTYDNGYQLIESTSSGIGKYDQSKCTRIDSLIKWSETRGLTMILVVWPHDYLCQSVSGWPQAWSSNPYGSIVSCANFYSDANAWTYQTKQYRYIIARWGYSTGLSSWQTVDEISGTDGWSNQTAANAWAAKIAAYFQTNDPFKHPTNGSHGNYWPAGNQAHDIANTEIYGTLTGSNAATTMQQLWQNNVKPCMMGETGSTTSVTDFHNMLWGGFAGGASITPNWWSYNQSWNSSFSSHYSAFEKFIAGINFAGLISPVLATVTVSGASAWGVTSSQVTFGWITGTISGKSFSVTGLANGSYNLEWWDCTAGTILSTSAVSVTTGSLTAAVPATSQTDMAFKLIAPTGIVAQGSRQERRFELLITYKNSALHLSRPLAENSVIDIVTALGRVIAHCTVTGANTISVPVKRFGEGVYFVRIASGNRNTLQRLLVK